jgi:hypothetical protein
MVQTTNVLEHISTTTMLRFHVIVAIAAALAASAAADQLDGFFHVPSVSLRSSCDANSPPSCSLSDSDGSCCYESPGVSIFYDYGSRFSSGLPSRVLLPWYRLVKTDDACVTLLTPDCSFGKRIRLMGLRIVGLYMVSPGSDASSGFLLTLGARIVA